jgi:hypothetical protein
MGRRNRKDGKEQRHWDESSVAREIRNRFQPLDRMLKELKQKDHAHAACLMQILEATVMMRICRRIRDELPQAWIATIHDSILTTPENAVTIKTIMFGEFARIGLPLTPNALKEVRYDEATKTNE